MSNQVISSQSAKSKLKQEIAEFTERSAFKGMVFNMTNKLLEKYDYGTATLKNYSYDASQFAVKELCKEIESGRFSMGKEVANRDAYLTTALKNRVSAFLHERLERSSKRKTKAQIETEQAESGKKDDISKFESGIRFSSTDTEKWRKSMMGQTTEISEYEIIDIESFLVNLGVSERSAAMMKMRLQGFNYTEIGQQFNLKESRARELIKESAETIGVDHKLLK
ncbi:hypothetical protein [Vibrio rotiferianus]|uniref:hypothetical protein n=1 Tax=Vibrio rotiferianus TaxID=190895 RepID=UPI002895A3C8|nr:hypothetical protein THOE12_10166 [Vibrio rotiferianus]